MTTVPPTNPGDTRSLRPVGWLAVITLLGWLAFALWPGLLLTLGIHDYGTNYLDSYALLAAVDAVLIGNWIEDRAAKHSGLAGMGFIIMAD